MATLVLNLSSFNTSGTLQAAFELSQSAKAESVQNLHNFVERYLSGNISQPGGPAPSISMSILEAAVAASGTFTLTSVIATDAVTVNGVTFTAVASGATGNQFNVGVSDALTAANLALAISNSVTALVAGVVSASSLSNVVTVFADTPGLAGNVNSIASLDGTIVASGALLTGGAADPNAVVYSF